MRPVTRVPVGVCGGRVVWDAACSLPALDTAATSCGVDTPAIGASTMGVLRTSGGRARKTEVACLVDGRLPSGLPAGVLGQRDLRTRAWGGARGAGLPAVLVVRAGCAENDNMLAC